MVQGVYHHLEEGHQVILGTLVVPAINLLEDLLLIAVPHKLLRA